MLQQKKRKRKGKRKKFKKTVLPMAFFKDWVYNVTRRIGKELFSGMGESVIYGGLHQFVSWYTNEALDRI